MQFVVSPCETGLEDPGDHLETCLWRDPDYDDSSEHEIVVVSYGRTLGTAGALRGEVEALVGTVDAATWRAVEGWLLLARRSRVPLDGRAVHRRCARCERPFHALAVPCGCVFCPSCWAGLAQRHGLGSSCPGGVACVARQPGRWRALQLDLLHGGA